MATRRRLEWRHDLSQYREPAGTTTHRIRGIIIAGLLVAIAAIAAAVGYQSLASTSPRTLPSIHVLRSEHRGALGEALSSTVWPAQGQAAVQVGERSLGMTHTRYTDPSGYDDATVSTAADQVRLVDRAMRLPEFASIVATPSVTLPVAGTVHNTDELLGHNGFVGVKTGSDDAAGGCFAFRAIRWIDGKRTTITGVVLGQPGHNQIAAGPVAADAMVDRIATPVRARAMPDLQQSTLSLRTAPRSHRSQLSSHVRRPYARFEDAAVASTLGRELVSTQSPHAGRRHE